MPTLRTTTPAHLTINDLATASSVILVELGAPFPITGAWTKIVNLKVILGDLTHTFPDDLDFLLVAPDGRTNFEFWSDAGGSNAISGPTNRKSRSSENACVRPVRLTSRCTILPRPARIESELVTRSLIVGFGSEWLAPNIKVAIADTSH